MIKIAEKGTYLYPDSNGYVQKVVHAGLIQSGWQSVIDSVVQFYREQLGDELISVYIRGSVAKGEAISFISDLDSFFISKKIFKIQEPAKNDFIKAMNYRFPFVNGIEMIGRDVGRLSDLRSPKSRSDWHELIKTQSICVWGNDFSDQIAPFRIEEMFAHSYGIEKELSSFVLDFKLCDTVEDQKSCCTWIMKRILRTGFEMVMIRERKWTRDLYLCYQSFIKYYPEKSDLMRRVLHHALNPTVELTIIDGIIQELQTWFHEEIKIHVFS